jgi:hypothetical protein
MEDIEREHEGRGLRRRRRRSAGSHDRLDQDQGGASSWPEINETNRSWPSASWPSA